jgi:hypothetical protein
MHYMKINVFNFLFQSNIIEPSFIRHMYLEDIKAWVYISVADPDPHPDPLVTSSDPARDPSNLRQKIVRKTLISTVL